MRNYLVTHSFIPLSTNGGFTLWIGNNPYITEYARGHCIPTEIPIVKEKLKEMSEAEINSYLVHSATSYIKENPLLYWQRVCNRFCRFWAPFPHRKYYSYFYWLAGGFIYLPLFFLAFSGALFAKEKQKVCSLFYLLFLSQSIVYMALYACIRYRFPIEPYLIILATSGFYVLK